MGSNETPFVFSAEFSESIALYRGIVRVWIEQEGEDAGKLKAEFRTGEIQELGYVSDYFYAKENGYEGTMSQWIDTLIGSADNAQIAESSASEALGYAIESENSAEDSEAYAIGTRDSTPVSSEDPAYNNNSKYYAELASDEIDSFNQAFGTATTTYQNSLSGTTHPTGGTWTSTPNPEKGKYTWAKTSFDWDGGTVDLYNVSYMGTDGAGLVESVNGKDGVVVLYGSDITVSDQDNRTVLQAFSDVIDDTAGTGDYDSTWSASKIKGAIDNKADKSNATFSNSVSMGRDESSIIAPYSSAIGQNVVASGASSHAEGRSTTASGNNSHAEGQDTQATSMNSHAEGSSTVASGTSSHAEGNNSHASGNYSHAQGHGSISSGLYSFAAGKNVTSNGTSQFAFGKYNVPDLLEYPEWVSETNYVIGDKIKITNSPTVTYYECIEANSDASFTSSKWKQVSSPSANTHIEVVGNGTDSNTLSNARALDQDGNEYLKGKLYIQANANSTGGYEVAKLSDIPDISGKVDKYIGSAGNVVIFGSNGTIRDSGRSSSGIPDEISILTKQTIASRETSSSSSALLDHKKGEFISFNNSNYLYRVTQDISAGQSISQKTRSLTGGMANELYREIRSIYDHITIENIPAGTYTSQEPYTINNPLTEKGNSVSMDMHVINSDVSDNSALDTNITVNINNNSIDIIGVVNDTVTIDLDVLR